MIRATKMTLVAAATILAGIAVFCWALRPLGFASYLSDYGASEAEIIRQYWPHRLIEPGWVSGVPDRLINWSFAEAFTRLTLVGGLWLLSVGIVGRGIVFPLHRPGRSKSPIEAPTP